MDVCNIISAITNIVFALAAVVGVVIAALGLSTWRHELHGQADFELARRIMRGVYELHNEIQQIRNIFSPEHLDAQYERLNKKASGLDVALLEAKILWGDKLQVHKQALKECLSTLRLALRRQFRSQKGKLPVTDKQLEEIDAVLWGDDDHEDDEFATAVRQAVAGFEGALGTYLKRRS